MSCSLETPTCCKHRDTTVPAIILHAALTVLPAGALGSSHKGMDWPNKFAVA
jgi:hypothetical protein